MTLRQASNKVRKALSHHNCKVIGKTISFEGLGFGSAGFIDIECSEPLPPQALELLKEIKPEINSPENKLILSLNGPAYPFGLKI
jgi:hypothetical protein